MLSLVIKEKLIMRYHFLPIKVSFQNCPDGVAPGQPLSVQAPSPQWNCPGTLGTFLPFGKCSAHGPASPGGCVSLQPVSAGMGPHGRETVKPGPGLLQPPKRSHGGRTPCTSRSVAAVWSQVLRQSWRSRASSGHSHSGAPQARSRCPSSCVLSGVWAAPSLNAKQIRQAKCSVLGDRLRKLWSIDGMGSQTAI